MWILKSGLCGLVSIVSGIRVALIALTASWKPVLPLNWVKYVYLGSFSRILGGLPTFFGNWLPEVSSSLFLFGATVFYLSPAWAGGRLG